VRPAAHTVTAAARLLTPPAKPAWEARSLMACAVSAASAREGALRLVEAVPVSLYKPRRDHMVEYDNQHQ